MPDKLWRRFFQNSPVIRNRKTIRFSEPNAEILAKQADVVFLALPHGVAAEYRRAAFESGLCRH